jgi:hypothetical protein
MKAYLNSTLADAKGQDCTSTCTPRPTHHCLYHHHNARTTEPIEDLKLGESTSLGTGMMISTLLAMDLDLNCDLALIMYSMRLLLCGSTTASTQINGFTWVLIAGGRGSRENSGVSKKQEATRKVRLGRRIEKRRLPMKEKEKEK